MNTLRRIAKDCMRLFYPDDCPGCRGPSLPGHLWCVQCAYHLRMNDLHLFQDNLFTLHFQGRIPITTGTAMYVYQRGGRVQHLIQSIKYYGHKEVARQLGRIYGQVLKDAPLYREIEGILPVPLHPQKLKTRGFNQSTWFGKGLAEVFQVPVLHDAVVRRAQGKSQTTFNRWERADNLSHAFALGDPSYIENRHLLVIDDVLTTGATLESVAKTLCDAHPASLRLCTIAMGIK